MNTVVFINKFKLEVIEVIELVNMVLKVKELKENIGYMIDDLLKHHPELPPQLVDCIRNWDVDQFRKLKGNFLVPVEILDDLKNVYDKAEAEKLGSGPFAVVHGVYDDENILITTTDGVCLVLMGATTNSFLVLETKLNGIDPEMCIRVMNEDDRKNYAPGTFFAEVQQEWIDNDVSIYKHFKKLVQRHDSAIEAMKSGFMFGNARMS